MRVSGLVIATVALLVAWMPRCKAQAVSLGQYCGRIGTDHAVRPIPPSWVPIATTLFHLESMPAEQVLRSTYFRCANGRVLVCNIGANLVLRQGRYASIPPRCGCLVRKSSGSDSIPMSATGHATIYQWRCDGGKPAVTGSALAVDLQGFTPQNWKPANGD